MYLSPNIVDGVDLARVKQNPLSESGLSTVDVGGNADVAYGCNRFLARLAPAIL